MKNILLILLLPLSIVAQTKKVVVVGTRGGSTPITLTTTGTSGASTLTGSALNIPNYAGGGGTVTNVATGLGLLGGAITTTGTIIIDTSSVSILSRQRAASTYQPTISLTTTGSGASTLVGNALNIPVTAGTTYTGTAPVVVTGSVISVNDASATVSGVVNTTTQNFAGAKTFNNMVGVGTAPISNSMFSSRSNSNQILPFTIFNRNATQGWSFNVDAQAVDDGIFGILNQQTLVTYLGIVPSSGNVGIGINGGGTEKLDVNGNIKSRGNLYVSSLATGVTAPTTTGTTKMVTVDANGLFSNAAIPTGGGTATDTSFLRRDINLNTTAITTKLNITDTANIRLRAIAGTNTTITGNYPNLTFNSTPGGGGTGIVKAYAPFVLRNDSVFQKFNVLAYGADNTGVNDATASIQAAINAADAVGGGDIIVPKGRYKIAGALDVTTNSQIKIPIRNYSDTLRSRIRIIGEGGTMTPNGGGLAGGAATPASKAGTTFFSTLTTGTAGAAIIGTSGTPNAQTLYIENIGFEVKNNPLGTGPSVGGINWKNGANCSFENIYVTIDTSGFRSTFPTNDISAIETPDNSYGELYYIKNVVAAGFRNGFKIGEHVVLDNVVAMTCFNAINIKDGYHSSTSIRTGAYWCANSVFVSSGTIFPPLGNFRMDIEWQQIGKWYDAINTMKDTANRGTGKLIYTIIEANVGKNNARFSKAGGINIFTASDDDSLTSRSISIGNNIALATSKSILFAGTGGKLQQSNFNLNYDSTNIRLGIGVTSPLNKIDISSSSSVDGIQSANTSSTGVNLMQLYNNLGKTSGIASYGSSYASNGFAGNASVYSDNSLILTTDAQLTSGGGGSIQFRTGGYASGQEKMRLFSTGNLVINSTTDNTIDKLQVNGSILSNGNLTFATKLLAPLGTSSAPSYTFTSNTATGLLAFNGSGAAGDEIKAVSNTLGAGFSIQNNNAGGFSGIEYYDNIGNLAVFSGYKNGGTGEFRFNNVATNAFIDFKISSNSALKINNARTLTFSGYGAGTLTTDASGNVTATSDERLKTNIKPATYGLIELMKLKPITYSWNAKSGNETKGTYLGFSAQNVKASIPYGTGEMKDGYLTLQDRAIMATLVNAVKEQQAQIEALKLEIKKLKK